MGDFNTLSRFDYKQHEQSNLLTMLKRKDHAVSDEYKSLMFIKMLMMSMSLMMIFEKDDDDYIDNGDDHSDDVNLVHVDPCCIFYYIRFLKDYLRNGLIIMKITSIILLWMFCYPLAYMMDA